MTPPNTTPATTPVSHLEHKPRKLVLCFDDAKYPFSSNFSNVLKLFVLLRDNGDSQLVYYDPGVGTSIKPGFWSYRIDHSTLRKLENILDDAFALYRCEHVIAGYEFLVEYYNPGDEVYFFGFSRGTYTARVVAAMLHKVGLISQDKLDNEKKKIQIKISLAYDHYMSATPNDEATILEFKKQYCCPIHINFLGVWDTVSIVKFVLSLDEHRARLRPNLFRHGVLNKSSELQETDEDFQTDVKEVRFADVGGGNVRQTAEHDIANISLRWMIEVLSSGCQLSCGTSLIFTPEIAGVDYRDKFFRLSEADFDQFFHNIPDYPRTESQPAKPDAVVNQAVNTDQDWQTHTQCGFASPEWC